ncbi:MAG: transketolase [Ignavibacteria bacterium]|nr:MAG: transketolase [Ignavibacteria bacterium]KAF0161640.1 MAG: transketolase [Ignavibacteria bacterium]
MTYADIVLELINEEDRYMIMTSENRAAFRALPPLIPQNFIDTGITEQTMIGMAAGLALRGRVPVVHALATFLTMRAFEFIRTDVGIANLPVKLVGAVPGFLSDGNGPTHQAIEDVSIMRGIPPMNVFCPADENDMLKGLKTMITYPSPFYMRYNPTKAFVEHSPLEIGKAETFGDGTDIAILVYGFLFGEAFKTKQMLEEQGKSVRLINIRTPKPIDEEAVIKAATECKLVVTLEDHLITGGLYTIVSELLLSKRISANVVPIALKTWFRPGLLNEVLEYEGFTAEQIYSRILGVSS